MIGVIYLHTNGDLIYKPKACFASMSVADYMDSPFVENYWIIPEDEKSGKEVLEHIKNYVLENSKNIEKSLNALKRFTGE